VPPEPSGEKTSREPSANLAAGGQRLTTARASNITRGAANFNGVYAKVGGYDV
jgi:hypothetical protein